MDEKLKAKRPLLLLFDESEPWDRDGHKVERCACPSCRHKLMKKHRWCPNCGQKLTWAKSKK